MTWFWIVSLLVEGAGWGDAIEQLMSCFANLDRGDQVPAELSLLPCRVLGDRWSQLVYRCICFHDGTFWYWSMPPFTTGSDPCTHDGLEKHLISKKRLCYKSDCCCRWLRYLPSPFPCLELHVHYPRVIYWSWTKGTETILDWAGRQRERDMPQKLWKELLC